MEVGGRGGAGEGYILIFEGAYYRASSEDKLCGVLITEVCEPPARFHYHSECQSVLRPLDCCLLQPEHF